MITGNFIWQNLTNTLVSLKNEAFKNDAGHPVKGENFHNFFGWVSKLFVQKCWNSYEKKTNRTNIRDDCAFWDSVASRNQFQVNLGDVKDISHVLLDP